MEARGNPVEEEPGAGGARPMLSFSKLVWGDAVALVFILACAARLTHNIDVILDIDLSDSTRYLIQGVRLREAGLPPAEWSPIYALWYYLLSLLEKDNIRLYYVNYVLLTCLTPLLLYAYLRRIAVGPLIALCAALVYLLSYANVAALPYVTKFAAMLLLLCLIVTTYVPRRWHYTSLIVSILAVSFVRPEQFLSFLLFGGLAVVVLLWRSRRHGIVVLRRSLPQMAVVLLVAVIFIGAMGNPLRGDRGLRAFRHHFSWNYVRWQRLAVDPWSQCERITRGVFGDFDSIPQAARQNPRAFLRHVGSNASRFPASLAEMTLVHLTDGAAPAGTADWVRAAEAFLLFLAIVLAIGLERLPVGAYGGDPPNGQALLARHRSRGLLRGGRGAGAELGVLLLVVLPPLVMTSLLVYPRHHCLQLPVVLFLLLIALALSYRLAARFPSLAERLNRPVQIIWLGVLFLACTPSPASGWSAFTITMPHKPGYAGTDVKATLLFVRSLPRDEDVSLLWSVSWPERQTIYLGDGFESVDPDAKDMPFDQFVTEYDLDVIAWPGELAKHENFADDPNYRSFVQNVSGLGFEVVAVPNTQRRRCVLLRQGRSESERPAMLERDRVTTDTRPHTHVKS